LSDLLCLHTESVILTDGLAMFNLRSRIGRCHLRRPASKPSYFWAATGYRSTSTCLFGSRFFAARPPRLCVAGHRIALLRSTSFNMERQAPVPIQDKSLISPSQHATSGRKRDFTSHAQDRDQFSCTFVCSALRTGTCNCDLERLRRRLSLRDEQHVRQAI